LSKGILFRKVAVLQGILLICVLLIIARLIEVQILRGEEYANLARSQHYGGVVLPAKRGDIFSRNSRTEELSILATNTTLDMVYLDPLATDDPEAAAAFLSSVLLTKELDERCRQGNVTCPRGLRSYYAPLFERVRHQAPVTEDLQLPVREDIMKQWSTNIASRALVRSVDFVPLLYSATLPQLRSVEELGIPGIGVNAASKLIYANPTLIPDHERPRIARILSPLLDMQNNTIAQKLRKRHLRYVPVLHQLTPDQSAAISKGVRESAGRTEEERSMLRRQGRHDLAEGVKDPLRGIALLPEHWRFYPDATLASHLLGFLNINGEPQYGIERTFDHILRGKEGHIQAITDPFGGEIRAGGEAVVQARDGDTVVLTIDRFIQKRVEELLDRRVKELEADSGQAIVLDPKTGRILAMANSPLFDSNNYGSVYALQPIDIPPEKQEDIVVEVYHPEKRTLVVRAYLSSLLMRGGQDLSLPLQKKLSELSGLYDLEDLTRYYLYVGENSRREIFPDELGARVSWHAPINGTGSALPQKWLTYGNRLGVGAYLNRAVLEIYEPGSVFKPITMAIAIDHREVTPLSTYDDTGPVEVDEYTIKNALDTYYGEVNMVECLQFSINTCLVSVSGKLGKKLFEKAIRRFGLGRLTGVELEDELPGEVLPWKRWSNALLATASYGQGISATPLQVVTAFAAIANGGLLMKPTIVDSVIRSDGSVERAAPRAVDQVVTEETAATVTAMLVASVREGYGRLARVEGYAVAGKTGTSQIAGPGGKYETGTGSTIASFAAYAPASDPKFAVLVKIDRPRKPSYLHGAQAAAPVFKDIAKFLFQYYGIPPEEG
jgi:cell division protein FtsI/penicillin-binding protein 2